MKKCSLAFSAFLLICQLDMPLFALDLETAIQRVYAASPILAVAEEEVEMAGADQIQASLRPNPEFSFVYNSVGFIGHCSKNDLSETTYGLSQLIETGGKRNVRMQVASAQQEITLWDLEIAKSDLARKVGQVFLEAVGAQENLKLNRQNYELACQQRAVAAAKVKAGKHSPVHAHKAVVAAASCEIDLRRAERAFKLAKEKLSALWAGCESDFEELDYPLYDVQPVEPLPVFLSRLECLPAIERWDAELEAAQQNKYLQELQKTPDFVVQGGVSQAGFQHAGIYVGFSVPLPVADRNQGNILRASHEICQVESKKEDALLELKTELTEIYRELESLYEEAVAYREQVVEPSQQLLKDTQESFQQGKFDFAEVLEAQKTLFDAQEHYLKLLVDFHTNKVDLEYLTRMNRKAEE